MSQLLERPQFYEGQFIGAADLDAIVAHARAMQARHDLGWHTWGIAEGLRLHEQPGPGGAVDLFVLPGLAVDGFGRLVVVPAPFALTADLFKNFVFDPAADGGTPAGRLVEVWLRYDELPAQPPRRGFESCAPGTPFARVAESFRIEVGARPTPAAQQERIALGDYLLFAEDAVQAFAPQTPAVVLADESVGAQALPAPGQRRRWLIPLGAVRWLPNVTAGQAGSFVARDAADRAYSSSLRRTVGVVAGAVQAAEESIRLRHRLRPYSAVVSDDLVWVEGSLRAEGDVRLFGGRLSWHDATGSDGGAPLDLRRSSTAAGETLLQAAIGESDQGQNRFGVGPLVDGPPNAPKVVDEKLSVLDNGNVGIGTTAPGLKLDIRGDFGRADGPATLNLFGSRIGDVGDGVLFLRSGGGAVAFDGGDNVGIGTAAPNRPLAIQGSGTGEELISFLDANAATKWHLNLKAINTPGLNVAETGVADGRLFLQPGGNVGIGTQTPALRLDIQGDFGRTNGAATMALFGSRIGDIGDGRLFLRSGGGIVCLDGNDSVGIGTSTPQAQLELNGGDLLLRGGEIILMNGGNETGRIVAEPPIFLGTTKLKLTAGDDDNPPLTLESDGTLTVGRPSTIGNPGTSGQTVLVVHGDAVKSDGGTLWSIFSDARLKTDVTPLQNALERLLALRGVSFAWKDPAAMGAPPGPQMGFVADDVQQAFPDWVRESRDGLKVLTLRGFEALVVESVRELKQENESLRGQVTALEARLAALEARLEPQPQGEAKPPRRASKPRNQLP